MDFLLQLIWAFLGSLGFALIFNVGKRHLPMASLGGLLAWGAYLIAENLLGTEVIVSAVIASAAAQIWAEGMARLFKAPTTMFSISAVVPLIPGGSLYRTMEAVVRGNWEEFSRFGFSTLQMTFGIAIGTSFVAAFLILWKKRPRRH